MQNRKETDRRFPQYHLFWPRRYTLRFESTAATTSANPTQGNTSLSPLYGQKTLKESAITVRETQI